VTIAEELAMLQLHFSFEVREVCVIINVIWITMRSKQHKSTHLQLG
jgi:hypothetical protein